MCAWICFALLLAWFPNYVQAESSQCDSGCAGFGIGQNDVDHFFSKCSWDVGFGVGGGVGLAPGASLRHDFVLGSVHLGRVLSDTCCSGHWYEGNWEVYTELFGGYQVNHDGASLFGIIPFARYNFMTHTQWVPFVEAGAGIDYTDIGLPDLGSEFNFTLQAGIGVHRFLCRNLALTLESRFMHISNGGTASPNRAVDTPVLLVGLCWFL
jgi:opacity protein-like surface antigen